MVWSCHAKRGRACLQKGYGYGSGREKKERKAKI